MTGPAPRTVVVTGGGTGIGFAVAQAFVAAGDRVVITGRRKGVLDDAVAALGPAAGSVAFDASDPAQVGGALIELPSAVDVLVNNAGGNTDFAHDEPVDLVGLSAAWQANFEANVLSAVLVTESLRPRMGAGGRIVNFSSIGAHRPGAGSYAAAKAAIEAWTFTLAAQLGPEGITANVIAPGYIEATEFFRAGMSKERLEFNIASTLNKRAGTPEDIAATVLFLASPGASHITGQTLHVNGGAFLGR
jgi:NAD(P)-dependent dehydrogenase (short-subunit alcohol dehydrogenase family)